MLTAIKAIAAIISAVAILCVAALLYVEYSGLDMWVDDIEQQVSAATGFDVAIQGELDVSVGNPLAATVHSIEVDNPQWPAAESQLATIERFHVELNTWSLLRGPIEVHSVQVAGLSLSPQTNESGDSNWQVERQAVDEAASGDPAIVHRLDIADSSVSFAAGSLEFGGEVEFVAGERPTVSAKLSSAKLDLSGPDENEPDEPGVVDDTDPGLLFSDARLEPSWFKVVDLEAKVTIESLQVGGQHLDGLEANVSMLDGALTIDPMSFSSGGGRVAADLHLTPAGDRLQLQLQIALQQVRFAALAAEGQDPGTVPPLDLDVQFDGTGQSLHEMAAAAQGSLSGAHGNGQLNMQSSGLLFSDLLTSVLRAVNPLAEAEQFATLECSVIDIGIEDGVATVNELAAQMERLTIVGDGDIDLGTEEVNLIMQTKTREGLGLSLGGVVNSMLAIGGTLKQPAPKMDAAGSVTTAGAAVATGGLSILAKGLWDRISGETDLCAVAAETSAD